MSARKYLIFRHFTKKSKNSAKAEGFAEFLLFGQ
jgi:hypothetical protein